MRIAFTGTHKVGKTTLAEIISDNLPDHDLMPEPYLQLEDNGYSFSEVPVLEDYIRQFSTLLSSLKTVKIM